MPHLCRKCIREKLKREDLGFGEKLEWVREVISDAEALLGAQIVGLLLDEALLIQPSKQELYYLCEASESNAIIGEYLRGFFMSQQREPQRLEMAERLEQVLMYRMHESPADAAAHTRTRLHQTVCSYLMHGRN